MIIKPFLCPKLSEKENIMSIQPEGEHIKKAIKWLSEQRQENKNKTEADILQEVSIRFNLSPNDTEYIKKFIKG